MEQLRKPGLAVDDVDNWIEFEMDQPVFYGRLSPVVQAINDTEIVIAGGYDDKSVWSSDIIILNTASGRVDLVYED